LTYPQIDLTRLATLELLGKFPHNLLMPNIMIHNIPDELLADLKICAKKSGLTLQQVVIKALEKYVEKINIDSWAEAKLKRASLPKIKASTIVDAIDSERKRER
jgi:hypothetical protein